ncbi:MAG: ATP-dependent Clp protease proteolytic subunit [Actinomycetota bacterium]
MDYRVVFNGNLNRASANALRSRVAEALEQPDLDRLTVVLSSEGGSTREGLALYHFLRVLPHPVEVHAAGHVGSAAVPVFLGGRRRTCAPVSRFFFHAFRWSFGEGSQSLDQIDEASQRVVHDTRLAREIAERHTKIPPEELDALYGRQARPVIVDPDKAIEWGLADQIVELNPEGAEQSDVRLWTVSWS